MPLELGCEHCAPPLHCVRARGRLLVVGDGRCFTILFTADATRTFLMPRTNSQSLGVASHD